MGDDHSNGTTGDTLESLKAERQDLEKTVAYVRQMTRDFDALTEQEELFVPERIALCLKLKGPHLRRCVWKGFTTPEAFQWHKEALATQKALGEQMLRDAAAFGQALVAWAEGLEKREKDFRARAGQLIVRDPINHAASDESRSQDNSGGYPGVLIYTNNWDTYVRYTGSQKGIGQLPSANVIFVSPNSMNNLYLAANVPGAVEPPTYKGISYAYRVTINQSESWYYYSARDAQTKQESITFNAISSLTPLMVGFSPTAGVGGDLGDAVSVAANGAIHPVDAGLHSGAGSSLVGVTDSEAAALADQIRGITFDGQPAVCNIEAFGSRAGSTFRDAGPTSTSDLDVFVTLDSNVVTSPAAMRAVLTELDEIAEVWHGAKGFPLRAVTELDILAPQFKLRLLDTPFVPIGGGE